MRHELVAHGAHDGVDVVETRIALARERFLQSLAGHADFGGHVRDPFDAGDDAQGGQQNGRVTVPSIIGEGLGEKGVNTCIDQVQQRE